MLNVVLAALVLYFAVRITLSAYLRFRGTRIVTCPETHDTVAVEVNAGRAALTALLGERRLRLQDCTRWPERQGCGQECLAQVETAADGCLARHMLAEWYRDTTCVRCGKEIGELHALQHRPALMNAAGETCEWSELPMERLPEILATHFPVCWDCHVVARLERRYPDRIVDRSGVERGDRGQWIAPR
jgi:hypothetical protein